MYKAIKKFEVNGQTFQIGDDFPAEFVQDRLIKGKKIGLVNGSKPIEIVKEIKEELITEVIEVQETEERIVDTGAEYVKELEDELLKLRIENAFLKELRRLRLEDEAKMRERQESSTVSEDSSN